MSSSVSGLDAHLPGRVLEVSSAPANLPEDLAELGDGLPRLSFKAVDLAFALIDLGDQLADLHDQPVCLAAMDVERLELVEKGEPRRLRLVAEGLFLRLAQAGAGRRSHERVSGHGCAFRSR